MTRQSWLLIGFVWLVLVVGAIVGFDRHALGHDARDGIVIAATLFALVTSRLL